MDFKCLDWFDNVESRPHPWPGLNWLTAMLYVSDVKMAKDFYELAFGFVPILAVPNAEDNFDFVRMRYRGSNFTLSKEGSFEFDGAQPSKSQALPPFMLYVYVDDVDKAIEQALSHGCELLQPTRLEFWGDRKGRVRDPFGYIWELATRTH